MCSFGSLAQWEDAFVTDNELTVAEIREAVQLLKMLRAGATEDYYLQHLHPDVNMEDFVLALLEAAEDS